MTDKVTVLNIVMLTSAVCFILLLMAIHLPGRESVTGLARAFNKTLVVDGVMVDGLSDQDLLIYDNRVVTVTGVIKYRSCEDVEKKSERLTCKPGRYFMELRTITDITSAQDVSEPVVIR